MEEGRSAFKMITYTYRKDTLGRPKGRWEDNIRMDLNEVDVNTRNWVNSAQDRDYCRAFVNAALNLWNP